MIAHRLIEDAKAAGCSIEVEGGDLVIEADRDPPAELITELREHKAELIAVLVLLARDASPPPEAVQDADNLDERAPIVEYGAGAPRRWAEGFAAMSVMPAPAGFSPERWCRIIDAAGVFIDRWAGDAVRCGWSDLDLFGAHPDRPVARFDAMGLVMLLDRRTIVGIDADGADLVTQTGARQRYRRRPLPADTVSLWDLAQQERRRERCEQTGL
jgi:hypothetical protein